MKTTTQLLRNSLHRLATLIPLLLICFWLQRGAQAVSPPPDGAYAYGNTAEGGDALFNLTTGSWNSAFGFRALYKNTMGYRNTAVGYEALYNTNRNNPNLLGGENVAVGAKALFSNTTGTGNIAIGVFALHDSTTGSNNIAIGNRALQHLPLYSSVPSGNTVIGDSFASSPDTVSIGREPTYDHCNPVDFGTQYAYVYGHDNVSIGVNYGGCPEVKTLRVHLVAQDAVYVDAVNDHPTAGSPVVIDSFGQLGVATSSKRFKTNIKSMDTASEAILALKPVTFRYKKEIDRNSTPQFGLVAEEVEKVNPDLVAHDAKGNPYTVRYDAVNAMLLNEFIKEHRKVDELQTAVAQLMARLKEQDSKIERISHEFELSKVAPQVVAN
jgi:hypothetical protein